MKEKASVKQVNGKYGIVDSEGNTVVQFEYDEGYDFENGIAVLTNKNGSTYFNENGMIIGVPNEALEGPVGTYSKNDYLALKDSNNGLYCFIDQDGNFKTPYIWKSATNYCNGYSLVRNDTGVYVIELDGNIAISNDILYKYVAINPVFKNKLLIVYKPNDECGVIDITGKEIIECSNENSYIEVTDENIIVHKTNEQILYYDFGGNEIKGGKDER